MPRHMFIVSRDNVDLASYLRERFKTEIKVLMDRRRGERQQSEAGPAAERRQTDRRSRPQVDRELRLTSYAFVTLP